MNEFLSTSSAWGTVLAVGCFGAFYLLQQKVKKAWANPLLFSCGITFPWQGQLRSFRFLPDWAPDIPDEG